MQGGTIAQCIGMFAIFMSATTRRALLDTGGGGYDRAGEEIQQITRLYHVARALDAIPWF